VAPLEFTMRLSEYQRLGGHMEQVRSLADTLAHGAWHNDGAPQSRRTLTAHATNGWPLGQAPLLG
jgi:hypothetical protein